MKRDTVNVRIPRDLWEKLRILANEQERTIQTVTTRALRYSFMMGFPLDKENGGGS